MIPHEHEYASASEEKQAAKSLMDKTWYDLVQAEQQGASQEKLEAMFEEYMRAVEAYNRFPFESGQPGIRVQAFPPSKQIRRRKIS